MKPNSEQKEDNELEARKKIEAVLFSSGRKMTVAEIAKLTRESEDIVKKQIEILKKEFDDANSSLMIVQEGEIYNMTVREKYVSHVRKIVPRTELNKTVLETLAVIAWKAPIMQSEVIKIRTNKAYDHIDQLEESGFISKKKHSRSYLISLTQKFYDYFDLSEKTDLQRVFKRIEQKAEEPPSMKGIKKAFEKMEVYEGKAGMPEEKVAVKTAEAAYIEIKEAERAKEKEPEIKLIVEKEEAPAEEAPEEESEESEEEKQTEEPFEEEKEETEKETKEEFKEEAEEETEEKQAESPESGEEESEEKEETKEKSTEEGGEEENEKDLSEEEGSEKEKSEDESDIDALFKEESEEKEDIKSSTKGKKAKLRMKEEFEEESEEETESDREDTKEDEEF